LIPSITKKKYLPKLCYNIMSDKKIKELLREHGIITKGDRNSLIRRHKEFTIRHNAQVDNADPKPISGIVNQLNAEEGKVISLHSTNPQKISVSDKEFDKITQDIKRRKS